MTENAGDRALAAASQLEKIGFVDFTVDLVKGVYEVIVKATMDQLQAYANLVTQISKDLSVYQAEMIGADNSPELNSKIDSFIKDVLDLDPTQTSDYTLSSEKATALKEQLKGLELEDATADPPTKKTIADVLTQATGSTDFTISPDNLKKFVGLKLKASVKNSQDLLKTILKIGMQKVVVTSGEIMTKLTFHVDAEDTSSSENRTTSQKVSGWGVGGKVSGGVGIVGKLLGGAIGGSLSGGYSSRSLSVSVVNQQSSAATNIQIDILGQVRILFRTETFPTVEA
jgi:hypothetical protein